MLYLLFFCSGLSGLIYQIVWVRQFGNIFGNTVTSTSIVVAIFMLGLGVGSYAGGAWADRRDERAPGSLLRVYAYVELAIALLGFAISLLLPHLDRLAAAGSSYSLDAAGWYVLSISSYLVRGGVALVLLTPITLLMGATLTLIVRHLARTQVERVASRIGLLYGLNTLGAAVGCFLTDFALVPAWGLQATQMIAVGFNLVAAVGALWLASRQVRLKPDTTETRRLRPDTTEIPGPPRTSPVVSGFSRTVALRSPLISTSLTLALTGFAAMGMEILWLRHFNLLLGGFRAVVSLVLAVILAGIGAGSLLGGYIDRRTSRPAQMLMIAQALFVATALAGLGWTSFPALAIEARAIDASLPALTPIERWLRETWYNARPILLEAGLPSLILGCSFPLANSVIRHAASTAGRRSGALYLANTAGAVCGSLVAGFFLLPWLGLQATATALMIVAACAILPLTTVAQGVGLGQSHGQPKGLHYTRIATASLISVVALGGWLALPHDYVLQRAMAPPKSDERRLVVSEGVSEVIAVDEAPGRGRGLITNGHSMSSTAPLDQRYMRALAHIPLLAMERPSRVLVIGFGVGNTTHASTLHPSVERVEVADLSRHVLEHATYFRDANAGVLGDPRVRVYVNDGRQHLQMQPEAAYDLITLEPPPIAHAGVAALYSREFYALARSRLKPGGYFSQWLPAYQVPPETSLAMVRAFVDVFPRSVLLSGTQAELLLVGTAGATIEIDPERIARALERAPAVRADLRRFDLGTVTEIVGTFVGSADTLAQATRESPPVSDDRPLQEYVVRSAIASGPRGVPASIVDLSAAAAWCPRCFRGDQPVPAVARLDAYFALLSYAYRAPLADAPARPPADSGRRFFGSAYLGSVVPETEAVYNVIAGTLMREGRDDEAIGYLRRAVQLDPEQGGAQYELGSLLLERREFAEATEHLRAAVRARPDSAPAHNDLGTSLASMGELDEAVEHFQQAVVLDPAFAEGRRNLAAAQKLRAIRR